MNEPSDDSTDLPPSATVADETDQIHTALGGVEPRPYLEIRPSETPVDPTAAIEAMGELQTRLTGATRLGVIDHLRGRVQDPLVEWLIVADGRSDASVRSLVGSRSEAFHGELEHVLKLCFPNTYEINTVSWHPRMAEESLPTPEPGDSHTVVRSDGQRFDTTVDPYVAGVEYYADVDRKSDWQTPLNRFDGSTPPQSTRDRQGADRIDHRSESQRIPLTSLVEAMVEAEVPTIYQVLVRPYPDWSGTADTYTSRIDGGVVRFRDRLWDRVTSDSGKPYIPSGADQHRIQAIDSRRTDRSFVVTARAVALTRDEPARADKAANSLQAALENLDGSNHRIRGSVRLDGTRDPFDRQFPGLRVYKDLIDRYDRPPRYQAWRRSIPFRSTYSHGMIVDVTELPGFTVVDGAGLRPEGSRAIAARRPERTGLTLPPPDTLERYVQPGMELCRPLTHDRDPYDRPLSLPPDLQDRHLVVVGGTGAGKSILTQRALLSNVEATDGPEILFDYKGGGSAEAYLKMHYARFGDLDDVTYFDLSRTLPAISFFDVDYLLDAGIPLEEARSRKAGHYTEILRGLMGSETYDEAAESVKAIRNHLRALYDPASGIERVSHVHLDDALRRTQQEKATPQVSDDRMAAYFDGLVARDHDVFQRIMGGAVGRVERIATDGRLAPLFDHTAGADAAPSFRFRDHLDRSSVIVFDFGGMEAAVKRTLTLVLLSDLWNALKAREERATRGSDLPLVNLYLEETRDIANTTLFDTLLAEGRSFGLSVMMGMQFAEQLDDPDPESNTYQEALNETATFLVGNVSVDADLPRVLATQAMDPERVARRLSSMARGEWLVRPGSRFDEEPVKPFLARSLPIPAGHPDGEDPLSSAEADAFEAALDARRAEISAEQGISVADLLDEEAEQTDQAPTDAQKADSADDTDSPDADPETARMDTLLTHTTRMPPYVYFDEDADALRCDRCRTAHDPNADGMIAAIECCYSLDDVDADDIPIPEIDLKLSRDEVVASPWSLEQLLFLKVVHNARRLRYEPPFYDVMHDSMIRLAEYVGIESDEIDELVDAGLLHRDTDRPHRLYSIYADGREAIGESSRHGVDFGHGVGDIRESTEHILGVELGRRFVVRSYREDDGSAVEEVRAYHELREGSLPDSAYQGEPAPQDTDGYERRRIDVAGLDADGNVVVAVEVERIHSSSAREVPADFDKLAACDPSEAIWIVMNRQGGHDALEMLYNPKVGEPRIDKTYQSSTPLQRVSIDAPGLTQIYTLVHVRDAKLD